MSSIFVSKKVDVDKAQLDQFIHRVEFVPESAMMQGSPDNRTSDQVECERNSIRLRKKIKKLLRERGQKPHWHEFWGKCEADLQEWIRRLEGER